MAINVQGFYDAINNIANQQVNATPKDLTINAEIVNLYNVDTGEYKVEYQSNTFSAFAVEPTVTYSLGEHVYVLVPQGDFSQRKLILGRAVGQLSDSQAQDLTNFYIDQGPNWYSEEDHTYLPNYDPLQICAISASSKNDLVRDPTKPKAPNYEDQGYRRWSPEEMKEYRDPMIRYPASYMSEEELERVDAEFQNYAKFFEYLKIGASFKTSFLSSHSAGKYYLEATFIADNPKWVPEGDPLYDLRKDEDPYIFISYKLGFENFNGSPYQMPVSTPQKAYYKIDPGVLKGLYKVSLMQDGSLVCDVKPSYDEKGNLVYRVPEDNVDDTNNIFAEDIEIRFCRRVNLLDTPYFVWIEMPKGDSVYAPDGDKVGKDSVNLVPHMYHYAQEITDQCKIMWFREDLSIPEENNPNDGDRDEDGRVWTFYTGPGWRPIEQFIDGMQQDYRIEDDNSLTVNMSAVPWQWRYKLVCLYKNAEDHPFGEDIATVIRADSKYDLFIENFTDKGSNNELLRISDNNALVGVDINPATGSFYPEWFGTWYMQLDDNSYNLIDPPYLNGPLNIQAFLSYEHVLFRVACYDPMLVNPPDGVYDITTMRQVEEIGYLTYELNSATDGGLLIDWEGTKSFNYTALGQAYDHVSKKEYTLAPKLSWVHDISAYDLQLYAPDGQPLGSRTFYNPDSTVTDPSTLAGVGYTPASSMLTNMYQDSNNVLHFKVRQEYEADRVGGAKNTVICRVHTIKDDMWYESSCEIVFTKDGQQGTQGTGWTAPLDLTNSVTHRTKVVDNETGETIVNSSPAFTLKLGFPAFPMVLHERANEPGVYDQDLKQNRIFLRPFVTKDGKAIESIADIGVEREHYRLKIYWDVSFPQNAKNQYAAGASFLRICDPETGTPLSELGGQKQKTIRPILSRDGSRREPGIQAMTTWAYNDPKAHQYGAVEIRYEPGAGMDRDVEYGQKLYHSDLMYRFVVKCQVDVETNLATDVITRKMGATMGEYEQAYEESYTWHRIKSINSWYAIDVFIENNGEANHFDPRMVSCNWPWDLQYDSRGKNPVIDADYLEFYYGFFPDNEVKTEGQYIDPLADLTPTVQSIFESPNPLLSDPNYAAKFESEQQYQTAISALPEKVFKLKPKSTLNWQEGTVGVLHGFIQSDPEKGITGGEFFRNQIYHCNTYDNVDINGWDGEGIDINEENGTIFAPTIGAGFKGPLTNTFTGVLMGVNTAFLRKDEYEDENGQSQQYSILQYDSVAEEELRTYPYMTGIFGYQCGYASFGILENGTAFFGRADRGGRIIIDGYNATIYGGANGSLGSPEIGDDMWNNMRLTFVDLTHATSGYENTYTNEYGIITKQDDSISTIDDNDPTTAGNTGDNKPVTTAVQGIRQGFDGAYFGDGVQRMTNGTTSELPSWYQKIWEEAYIKGRNTSPWWLNWGKYDPPPHGVTAGDVALLEYRGQEEYSDNMRNYYLNYWKPNLMDVRTMLKIGEDAKTKNLTGFGPSRASTTPAIEIGQHPTGLMPGLLPWGSYEDVFQDLFIPGDRNFMVTYDGTLWAMNGVFLGNVIGSNIIGGRIQGAEIGIGDRDNVDFDSIRVLDEDCNWQDLKPPTTKGLDQDQIDSIYGTSTTHSDGTQIASKLYLWGGQIDLGSFHIKGLDTDSGYGDLVQFGHSDFVGPSHFYGNVGIGPNLGEGPDSSVDPRYVSDRGNLFQSGGYAALGIIMPEDDVTWHQLFAGVSGNMQIEKVYYATSGYGPGDPGIINGIGGSIEQSAMFSVNTYAREPLGNRRSDPDEDAYAGHFWPMAFRYSNASTDIIDQNDDPSMAGVHGYMTTMDIFKSKTFTISNGVGGPGLPGGGQAIDGSNYFRIGPWGYEFIRGYICYGWQREQDSEAPAVNRLDDSGQYGVRGVIGLVNRGGGGGATSPAIGMTSWGNAAIIMSSDENFMLKTKNWMSLRANASEDDLRNNDSVTETKIERSGGFLAELSMGSVQSTTFPSPSAILKVHSAETNRTHARAILQVVDWDAPDGTSLVGLVHSANARSGLQLTPDYTDDGSKPGTYLYTRKEDIHIIRYPDGTGTAYCQDSINVTEGLFRESEIVFYAKDRVTIAWGSGQGAHTDPDDWKHAAIFTGDGIQVINDGSVEGGPAKPDPDPGNGGGNGTPPTPATPGDKKYCIYLGNVDNAHGTSEITWQTNFVSISGKQVWVGGADNQQAHSPRNFMLFAQTSVDMRGDYAIPENQFHIYARFA